MAKAIAKLFRNPESATRAIDELKAQGYKEADLGILLRPKDRDRLGPLAKQAAQLDFPGVGEVLAVGSLAQGLSEGGGDPSKALVQALDVSPEAWDFYQFGLSLGGILVSVHGEGEHLAQAPRILRSAETQPQATEPPSPGFATASRMTATDPLDEKMTGDFRRY
jgi:hypothetical protein